MRSCLLAQGPEMGHNTKYYIFHHKALFHANFQVPFHILGDSGYGSLNVGHQNFLHLPCIFPQNMRYFSAVPTNFAPGCPPEGISCAHFMRSCLLAQGPEMGHNTKSYSFHHKAFFCKFSSPLPHFNRFRIWIA